MILLLPFCSLQGKQRLLYSLLDAMQSVTSQAVVIGVSCRLVCCFEVSYLCIFTIFMLPTLRAYQCHLQIPVNDELLGNILNGHLSLRLIIGASQANL